MTSTTMAWEELARRMGLPMETAPQRASAKRRLARMRKDGTGPAWTQWGALVLYLEADVERWLETQFSRTGPTAAPTRAAGLLLTGETFTATVQG